MKLTLGRKSRGRTTFENRVNLLRSQGMDDDFIARQLVDDAFRSGVDLRLKQHIVEKLVSLVKKEEVK